MDDAAIRSSVDFALTNEDAGPTFLHRFMGIEMSYADEVCVLTFSPQKHFSNRKGALHGGIIALLIDMSMGDLHRNAVGLGLTLETKVQFFKGVDGGKLRCESRFLKKGKRISFLETRVTNEANELVAASTATWQALG